jgi:hypothetical protein
MRYFICPGAVTAVSLAALVLAGCATLQVNSYLDRRADFMRYHAYAWADRGTFSTGDPRLDNNRFFIQRVEEAVDMQLTALGLEKSSDGAADILIHVHTRADQRNDTDVYEAGTLTIDVMDRRTGRLAWRGWAECSFEGVVENQAWMEATIDQAVDRILAQLPRKPL